MKEDFLHYIWLHKKVNVTQLYTTKGEKIEILHFGHYLQTSGPDFFNSKIIIDNQQWAGNIEIHVKSSDWYLHNHQKDENYDNVILHIVWEHDIEVFRKDNSEIPVLELKECVSKTEVVKYENLIKTKTWINCENQITTIDDFIFDNWKERLFFERLERKSNEVLQLLSETKNDWEAVLFCMLAKNFGLNTNGEAFLKIAKSIPFSTIRKERISVENLEALLFGYSNLLEENYEDEYYIKIVSKWEYLQNKYALEKIFLEPLQFYKLRPDNFPTIRLAQLASLYSTIDNVFSKCINLNDKDKFYRLFSFETNNYWKDHYNFDKKNSTKRKLLSRNFIDLIIINTIIPLKFTYDYYIGKDNIESILSLIKQIQPEKNAIINKFNSFKIKANDAFDSQSLLQLKNEYCSKNKCLHCRIGLKLIKN
ncbi:DUF2851 family protein [Flavobacterium sediminilitoris]|uniref:DUF2851 family protein n=1 Tax=Flavobacterium sediminilitoris TaxID=2024526 RepID=A0ABY4HHL5_9FLAO|nr:MULTISPECIES: DUF2851 family protein [Flavobacterium]UOX32230.1 DUF2851 family protein [Flavobacterium sediminilitoris]